MDHLYDVKAPAKINIFLHVNERRTDGYHLLQTVFRLIDLQDSLNFSLRNDGIISFEMPNNNIPNETNLVIKAAKLLKMYTRGSKGAHIFLEKNIPIGGGLGGGSSDAASTLIALNKLWSSSLNRYDLMKLANYLGADVPFFIFGCNAFASGIGNVLVEIDLPVRSYLIIQPDISISTADIFSDSILKRDTKHVTIQQFMSSPSYLFGKNDLEDVVFDRYPDVCGTVVFLKQHGFAFKMSGSGSCFFVEYDNISESILALSKIGNIIKKVYGSFKSIRFRFAGAYMGLIDHPLKYWVTK
ncbi:4-diphosphocytidyl-2-C-methyl-D-erythritol kinase [Candidatus Kinetoplastibacterium blastocrithidii TCC012E]|uniref:4-diphosphocytidyl-2-C-methyl-D-erythritol kinase n=1 Tax=Candidatus Kinetoplastidibacterium blastocrithidiae TCC012E TaxID=1208922 RepID=M1MCM2_9PROT|nr:4-(cytidine 5'-diphospho)-2-C-methyl-D-erythritol kinase [Candidatus Kinetoplastibacterium blastocrithidii]AFZ83449.1 4-(cytidine 5'-diphospho)-2-C-methyl-D-erythritol kinase [Candidatus Kinetoplastibacterium blastocrithidii (ex Strigomonas culicis)]AGF49545.1 4-diphosphocytidyl-2-C-methyl-D-erythritol kinase [Candidatus Kinetoplastibacterium blastocrithidii TCC012E]